MEAFPKKLICFSNSTKACSSVNKRTIFGKRDTESTVGRKIETFSVFLEKAGFRFGNPRDCGRIRDSPDRISKSGGASHAVTYDKRARGFSGIRDSGEFGKRSIRLVPPIKNRFTSNVFLVGKKDGGYRPVKI